MSKLLGKLIGGKNGWGRENPWVSHDSCELEEIQWIREKTEPDIAAILESKEELEKTIQLYEIINKLEELYSAQYEENLSDDDVWPRETWWRKFNDIRKRWGINEEIIKLEDKLKNYAGFFTGSVTNKFLKVGWWDFFFNNLDFFEDEGLLDSYRARKLVKLGYLHEVLSNKDRFEDFDIEDSIDISIKHWMVLELFDEIWYFEREDQIWILDKIIEKGGALKIWNRLREVEWLYDDQWLLIQGVFLKMLSEWVDPIKVREFSDNYFKNILK